jgi:hypothetical protein
MDGVETTVPPGETRTISWLRSHGWVEDRNGVWVDVLWCRMMCAQELAVARALAERPAESLCDRPQPRFF